MQACVLLACVGYFDVSRDISSCDCPARLRWESGELNGSRRASGLEQAATVSAASSKAMLVLMAVFMGVRFS